MTGIPPVELLGISGQQSPHYRGDGYCSGLQQQVNMIAHQHPGKAPGLGIQQYIPEPIYEYVLIMIVSEYLVPLYPTDYYVV